MTYPYHVFMWTCGITYLSWTFHMFLLMINVLSYWYFTHTDNISDYLHADMITTNKTSPIHRFFAGHGNPLMTRFTTCLISRCTILVSMYVIYIYILHTDTHTQHLWYIHIYLYKNTSPLMSPHIKYSPRNPGWVLGLFIFWYLGEGIIPIFSG